MTAPEIELTPEQVEACDRIYAWYSQTDKQDFRLGGLAGTGKTTIIGAITNRFNHSGIAYCAYTAKAASILRGKLDEQGIETTSDAYDDKVTTIHRLMYWLTEKWTGRLNARGEKIMEEKWIRRKTLPAWIDLIIVDEASMVSEYIWKDLLSYGRRVLAVGDYFQLPPINNRDFDLMRKLDYRLDTIHRQALDSPIIQVARWAREQHYIPVGWWSPTVRKLRPAEAGAIRIENYSSGLVLTGRNTTRVSLNRSIRASHGCPETPVIGDRVVCRRNNYVAGICNGETGTITQTDPFGGGGGTFQLDVALDSGTNYRGRAIARFFNSDTYKRDQRGDGEGDVFDYGYALTVHNAQGSQAADVIVIEERLPGSREKHARWLYTAVTRATDNLLIIGD